MEKWLRESANSPCNNKKAALAWWAGIGLVAGEVFQVTNNEILSVVTLTEHANYLQTAFAGETWSAVMYLTLGRKALSQSINNQKPPLL